MVKGDFHLKQTLRIFAFRVLAVTYQFHCKADFIFVWLIVLVLFFRGFDFIFVQDTESFFLSIKDGLETHVDG